MKTPIALLAFTLLLPAAAGAQGSLNDARDSVRKGTTEGIVLIPARKPAAPAPAASAPAVAASAPKAAATTAASTAPPAAASRAATSSAPGNLNEARDAVRKGTTEGIVLIPARKPAAASAAGGSGSILGGLIDSLRIALPPTGKSLQDAKNDDSPDRGIPIRSSASAPR